MIIQNNTTNKAGFIVFFLIAGIFSVIGQTSKPNIIYIYADDLGYGELGCYGQQKIKTPRLDQLAKEGMRFTRHYSSAPVCAPSRCMLLTGKHPGHSYIRGNYELGGFADSLEGGQMPLPENTVTIAHLLKNKGYTTGLVGKWGLGMHYTSGNPNAQGFDYFYGYLCQKQAHNYYPTHLWENGKWDTLNNPVISVHRKTDRPASTDEEYNYYKGNEYAPDKMTEKAIAYIDKNKHNPFYLYLSYPMPHLSLQVPDGALKEYLGKFDESPYNTSGSYAMHKYPLSAYAAMITYLDTQVGIVLDKIIAAGLEENTIILFSSDNGTTFSKGVDAKYFNSTAGLRGLKMDLYEGGIRVPFIAKWKGKIKAGSTSDHVSVQYDLMATLNELIRLKAPANDGISYLPTLLGKTNQQKKKEYTYFEYPENGGQLAIHLNDWKAVKTNIKTDKKAAWQVYNLKDDPYETKDVAADHPELKTRFDQIVLKEHRNSHIREWEFVNPKF